MTYIQTRAEQNGHGNRAEGLALHGNDSHIWVYIGRNGCSQSAHMLHIMLAEQKRELM